MLDTEADLAFEFSAFRVARRHDPLPRRGEGGDPLSRGGLHTRIGDRQACRLGDSANEFRVVEDRGVVDEHAQRCTSLAEWRHDPSEPGFGHVDCPTGVIDESLLVR